ncbi:MAG: hypothetical protein LC789_05915 [Actinobacteria bacterium]|nr:hypothetical protein [Actinomycetota bacterium]MCA1719937.1 hypothetical protein [Actinomycetota bacterium]
MELSGSTTANWVAKSANLLVDAFGSPARIGLLLPLHWQTVALVLAGSATGATVLLAATADELAGCDVAFVRAEDAGAALDAGVDDVLALSGHPLGAPATGLPAMVLDYAREVPSYGDHFGGQLAGDSTGSQVVTAAGPVQPAGGISGSDRVLTTLEPADPDGAAVLLGALRAGAGVVLLRAGDAAPVVAAERVTLRTGGSRRRLTPVA